MDSTPVYGLELLVLEGTGGKALATDHRDLPDFLRVFCQSRVLLLLLLLHENFQSLYNSSVLLSVKPVTR